MSKYAAPNDSEFLNDRKVFEPETEEVFKREAFQRDRDRVVHSRAFRRLMHKTQIFNANKGDHYRNRLTHSLEVNQIARSIGKCLGLNDELIEAIALGHDLGHTPFGHIGERTLHNILSGKVIFNDSIKIAVSEGFKHNYQSLQIIDNIEKSSSKYDGMNLTLAVREGILKHTSRKMIVIQFKDDGSVIKLYEDINYTCLDLKNMNIEKPSFTLEGQVVAIADEIAQCTHDLEDGLRSNIITIEELRKIDLVDKVVKDKKIEMNNVEKTVDVRNSLIKIMVGVLIDDVCITSQELLDSIISDEDIPEYKNINDTYDKQYIKFSDDMQKLVKDLLDKIRDYILVSQQISQSDSKAEFLIKKLFEAYYTHPLQLPDYIHKRYYIKKGIPFNRLKLLNDVPKLQKDTEFYRLLCDHIGCMTDQYVEREYVRLYMPEYI